MGFGYEVPANQFYGLMGLSQVWFKTGLTVVVTVRVSGFPVSGDWEITGNQEILLRFTDVKVVQC